MSHPIGKWGYKPINGILEGIPESWEIYKVSHSFDVIGSGTTPTTDSPEWYTTEGIPWITTGELRENTVSETEKSITLEALSKFTALRVYPVGSLVIAMYGATIGRLGILGVPATTNQACCVIAGERFLAIRFLYYWLLAFKPVIIGMLASGGGQPNISKEVITNLLVPAPPKKEQEAIATFLDRETSRLDALISEQRRLIDLLREKRSALISHAVTKGLDPNVPMKDSGVEWLGMVPEHWDVVPLKWYSRCSSGDGLVSEDYELGEMDKSFIPVVGGNGPMGYTTSANIEQEVLVVGRVGALCGNVHVVSPPAWVTDNALVLRPNSDKFDNRYLAHILRFRNLNDIAAKTAQPLITGTQVRSQLIPRPSLIEQLKIVTYLDQQTTRMDALISEAERSISLLQERRSALITAAVTGKIDVRGWVEA